MKVLKKLRKINILLITGLILSAYIGWETLNPFSSTMFDFHDETQVGRVASFTNNLKEGNIPPRLAPEFSFRMGMPVFNYYAPTAYWITSLISLTGIHEITAVKISFLLTLILSFAGMYYFLLKLFKKAPPAILGATTYVTSTYFATEIVIRGNLAETWFLVFFPLSLGLLMHNAEKKPPLLVQLATPLSLALLFTTHNMMGLLSLGLISIFIWLLPNKKRNYIAMGLGLLIDSYYFIPAILESSLIQADTIAKNFTYSDHFLCLWQLWRSNGWQFGGSLTGCEADLMSFKLGKPHIVLGLAGMAAFTIFALKILRPKKIKKSLSKVENKILLYVMIGTLGSLFLTLYPSQFIWDTFEPIMSLFQFPWRFLVFGMLGMGVFAGYLFHWLKLPFKTLAIIIVSLVLFSTAGKYIKKPPYEFDVYDSRFNSEGYIYEIVAYNIREYLVQGVDYDKWHFLNPLEVNEQKLEFDYKDAVEFHRVYETEQNDLFEKRVLFRHDGTAYVNVHYFPFWDIRLNGEPIDTSPENLDDLARPRIEVKNGDILEVKYRQTPLEQFANALTILGLGLLGYTIFKRKKSKKKS